MIFDFGQLTTSPIWAIDVSVCIESGDDPNPMSRLLSIPVLMASLSTGLANLAVSAKFGDMLADVVYILRCAVQTLDDQKLAIEARSWRPTPEI